jgi:heat shock protein HslJ
MRQATVYLALLPLASGYKINSGQLTLTEASGKELAVFSAQSKELGGTSWIVTGYNNGKQAVVSVLNGTELTADFSADGKLSGSAGCNRYNTTYKTSGKSIQIGPPASTRMMCAEPAGVMGQEAQYLKALESAATYRLDGDTLEFRTAEDAMAVTFKKVR